MTDACVSASELSSAPPPKIHESTWEHRVRNPIPHPAAVLGGHTGVTHASVVGYQDLQQGKPRLFYDPAPEALASSSRTGRNLAISYSSSTPIESLSRIRR